MQYIGEPLSDDKITGLAGHVDMVSTSAIDVYFPDIDRTVLFNKGDGPSFPDLALVNHQRHIPPNALGRFFYGSIVVAPSPYGDNLSALGVVDAITEQGEISVWFPGNRGSFIGHAGWASANIHDSEGHWNFWEEEGTPQHSGDIHKVRLADKDEIKQFCNIVRGGGRVRNVVIPPADAAADAPTTAGYPDDNPKTVVGITKPGFTAIPPVALIELGAAMSNGVPKYGLMNWRDFKVSSSVYYNAMLRHLFAWYDGEDKAQDSGVNHLGHIMACCAILLDAEASGQMNDDRPTPGAFSDVVKERTTA